MPEEIKQLRDKAEHCKRLACSITDAGTRATLNHMATEFEQAAALRLGEKAQSGLTHDGPADLRPQSANGVNR